jgi:cytochrome c biogenesis protein
MSAAEHTLDSRELPKRKTAPLMNRFLDFISSVRFGVSLLIILVVLSMIGMLIIQQNVQGFDTYFASLTPAEKLVYGRLGLFDIYHSWYFNFLLLILSLNIVLASIDRFPSAWSYIVKPKTWVTKKWLENQPHIASIKLSARSVDEATGAIATEFKKSGFKASISEKHGQLFVFGESGKWNRVGAYIVHVALLTLFMGHFVALQTGFDADVRMTPGDKTDQIQMIQFELDKKEKFNVQLPFSIACTDIQQKLIDPRGSIDPTNTLDWRTQIKIEDPQYGETTADISMNRPFTYRGYRFFQAQTIPVGNARTINLELTSQSTGEKQNVSIPRGGAVTLPDGTNVEYTEFLPDFSFNSEGKPDTRSPDYNNPVAVLNVTPPNADRMRVFAFAGNIADNIPVGAPKAGYKWRLSDFEKVPFAHVLSIKYDPYNGAFIAWYFGGFGLIAALGFVFFLSHKRIWALVENDRSGSVNVTLGGNANRNHVGFEQKFAKVVRDLGGEKPVENTQ